MPDIAPPQEPLLYDARITDGRPVTLQSSGVLLAEASQGLKPRTAFRARLVRAGRIRNADDSPGRFVVTEGALQMAVEQGLFDGLAVFADHPAWFENAKVKHLVGSTSSVAWNFDTSGVDATITFYDAAGVDSGLPAELASILSQMMDDQEEGKPVPDIGISIVFWPTWEEGSDVPRRVKSIRKVDSADIVFSPAADGRILEALSAHSSTEVSIMEPEDEVTEEPAVEETVTPDPPPDIAALMSNTGDLTSAGVVANPDEANEWLATIRAAGSSAMISESGLPQPVQDSLTRQNWHNPVTLAREIELQRQMLAQLAEDQVIDLPGRPSARVSGMSVPMDSAQNIMDYLFGVQEAPVPDPLYRRFDMFYSHLTGDQEFQGVFHPDRIMFAGADTTALANLAANAMNKVIMAQLALLTHYRWYEAIVLPTPNDGSIHDMVWASMGGIGALPIVPEGGAYDEITMDDVKETDSFVKYGGYVGITREMIRKSDLMRIQGVPRALAAASVKSRSSKIAAIFTQASGTGPTLDQDSVVLFHANHGSNVQTTAFGTTTAAWQAAAAECFNMNEVNSGDNIAIYPKFCLLPPVLYHTGLSVFGYGDGVPTTYAPFSQDRDPSDPRPVPIAVPHFTDVNDWAYITDPAVWPVIHMSFSADPSGRGFPAPELFAVTSETGGLMFSNDTLPVKIRDEFAYGVNGWRGVGKRNVA